MSIGASAPPSQGFGCYTLGVIRTGMDWKAANMPGQAELNLTRSVFLSSSVTLSKSFKFSELQGAHGSNGDKNFHLPEDIQKPPSKIFSNASSLHLVGISGVGCSPPPRSGHWQLLQWSLVWHPWVGFSSPIFPSHSRVPSPCIINASPKTLGLLKLDCNSLYKSGSVAVNSFLFKGMLS